MNPSAARKRDWLCIWCGTPLGEADDGAAFRFLAKDTAGEFTASPGGWKDQSPHIEGHEFYCHVRCFRASVPGPQQPWLEFALDEP